MDTNYTTKSQEAISGAMQAAAAAGNPQIEPAHLLVELLAQPDGVAAGKGKGVFYETQIQKSVTQG